MAGSTSITVPVMIFFVIVKRRLSSGLVARAVDAIGAPIVRAFGAGRVNTDAVADLLDGIPDMTAEGTPTAEGRPIAADEPIADAPTAEGRIADDPTAVVRTTEGTPTAEATLVAGADVGKTRCRVAIADSDGNRLHTVDGPGAEGLAQPGGLDDATAVVAGLVDKAMSSLQADGRRVAALAVGAAGARASAADAPDALALRLHQRTGIAQVAVTTDAVAAHAGALAGASGVVLAVGTGAVTLGIGVDGRDCQVDGWGQWLGDEGSGAWIGREALRAVLRALDGRGPTTTLMAAAQQQFGTVGALPSALAITPELPRTSAAFVPAVVACAAEGDAVAADVLDRAVAAWVESTATAARAVAVTTVACVGGLCSVDRLRESWRRSLPWGLAVVEAQGDAVDGAVLLARRSDLPHEGQVRRHEWGTP